MATLMSQLQNKFNENFWSSHFNAQSKCIINDKEKLVPVNQKGGGDFVKVVSPLANSGLAQSDSIVRKKRKRKSTNSKKQTTAKKRKVTKKRKVQKKKAKPKKKRKAAGRKKKVTKGKKKSSAKKKKPANRRSGKTKRR